MGEYDNISLFFSVEQKKQFLIKHGYRIDRVIEENHYENRSHFEVTVKVVAIDKDGVQNELHTTFEKVLKEKLLQL